MTLTFDSEYRPKAPWFGGDLQTVSAVLSPPRVTLDDTEIEELRIETDDATGDVLTGQRVSGTGPRARNGDRTVVLLHGLMGDLDRGYMRLLTRYFVDQGYAVVRMNLRGAGSSRVLCTRNYHAGFTRDLACMARGLAARDDTGKLDWIGISLSGNMLIKAASEAPFLDAADHGKVVSVSAPFDLQATATRFSRRRNFFYSRYLVNKIRKQMPLQPGLAPEQAAHLRRIKTIGEFDECFTAPANGYASADEYYQQNSARRFVLDARLPCMVMIAADDPWIDVRAYQSVDWQKNSLLTPVICTTGGHVGFHARGHDLPLFASWSKAFIAA